MEDKASETWIDAAIKQYQSPLLRYAKLFVFDLEAARDVVQDTFLKLCKEDEDQIRPKLAQWLFTVCRNRAIDVCRKEGRMKAATDTPFPDQADASASPGETIEQSETVAGLMQQVSRLNDQQQEVLRLKFHGGLSYHQIAEITGLTRSHVGVVLHTAISKLRQRMAT